jgi:hypothetical protein
MVNLYHRSRYVLRNYAYLGFLEREIRQQLALPENSVAFTREGDFYWNERDWFSARVKYVYICLVAGLLLMFLGATNVGDWRGGHCVLTGMDFAFAVPTVAFLVAYILSSFA